MQPFDIIVISEISLKIAFSIICIIIGFLILLKSSKTEKTKQNYFYIGIATFFFLFSLARICFIFYDFIIDEEFLLILFWRLASVITIIGLLILVLILEKYLVNTHYIFTLIGTIGSILTASLGLDIARILAAIIGGILVFIIIGLYLYIAKKSSERPRIIALKCAISIFILAAGVLTEGNFGRALLGLNTGILGTILMIIGVLYYFKINYQD
jgi:hypothetical protein